MATLTPERTRTRSRLFYGWYVVGGAMAVQALTGALFNSSFGAYVVLLRQDFGWSRTTFSLAYSAQQLQQGVFGPVQGWLIDRFGARSVLRAGMVLFGGGFLLLGRIESLAGFFAAMLVIAFGLSMGGFLPLAATLVNWFVRRRSTAMGLMSTGMGIGGFLAPAVAWSMTEYGWRATATASGVLALVVGLPVSGLMRHSPEPYGYLPDGDPRSAAPAPPVPHAPRAVAPRSPGDFTVSEAVRTPAFWLIAWGHASALLIVSAVNVHLVSHLQERLGYSVARGALIVTLVTTISMVGQIGGGIAGDRVSKRALATVCMFMHAAGLLVVAYATTLWMVLLFTVLHGLAWGMRGPQMQAIRADFFGRSSFGKIYGMSMPVVTVGTVGGPLIAGTMADRAGNYQVAFTVLAILSALGSLFWVFLKKPEPPHRAELPADAGIAA